MRRPRLGIQAQPGTAQPKVCRRMTLLPIFLLLLCIKSPMPAAGGDPSSGQIIEEKRPAPEEDDMVPLKLQKELLT